MLLGMVLPVQIGVDLRPISRSEHVGLRPEAVCSMLKPINSIPAEMRQEGAEIPV